jgi:nucleoid DNA-binding protein
MANEKLTWLELRKAVAQMAGVSEQEADTFLNAFVDAILNGLQLDKQVKIKGIGTFALKAVAPRKSINIATGEEFTIEGYNKLTFSAESMLKESVEKRIEQPKTEEVMAEINNDPIKKLGEQANEIVDLLADLGQAPNTADEPKVQEDQKSPEQPELPETPEQIEESEIPTVPETPKETGTPEQPRKKCNALCWSLVLVLLSILIGAGIYFRESLIQWWQCMKDCQPTEEIVEVPEIEEEVILPLAERPREYVNFIGIERVGDNSRLAWIAYKYYAQKDLWVFIYEANRDIIKHPAHVMPGQYIRIPELSEEYRNLYNPELQQLVDSLAKEYLSVKK